MNEQDLLTKLDYAVLSVLRGLKRVDSATDDYTITVYKVGDMIRADLKRRAPPLADSETPRVSDALPRKQEDADASATDLYQEPDGNGGPYYPDLDDPPWR